MRIDEQLVARADAAGCGTLVIAKSLGCTQRRVQQILARAAAGPPSAASQTPPRAPPGELVSIVAREIQRHAVILRRQIDAAGALASGILNITFLPL